MVAVVLTIGHTLRAHEALSCPDALPGFLEVVHSLFEEGVFFGHDRSIRTGSVLRSVDYFAFSREHTDWKLFGKRGRMMGLYPSVNSAAMAYSSCPGSRMAALFFLSFRTGCNHSETWAGCIVLWEAVSYTRSARTISRFWKVGIGVQVCNVSMSLPLTCPITQTSVGSVTKTSLTRYL
jgi:hypothetical protein